MNFKVSEDTITKAVIRSKLKHVRGLSCIDVQMSNNNNTLTNKVNKKPDIAVKSVSGNYLYFLEAKIVSSLTNNAIITKTEEAMYQLDTYRKIALSLNCAQENLIYTVAIYNINYFNQATTEEELFTMVDESLNRLFNSVGKLKNGSVLTQQESMKEQLLSFGLGFLNYKKKSFEEFKLYDTPMQVPTLPAIYTIKINKRTKFIDTNLFDNLPLLNNYVNGSSNARAIHRENLDILFIDVEKTRLEQFFRYVNGSCIESIKTTLAGRPKVLLVDPELTIINRNDIQDNEILEIISLDSTIVDGKHSTSIFVQLYLYLQKGEYITKNTEKLLKERKMTLNEFAAYKEDYMEFSKQLSIKINIDELSDDINKYMYTLINNNGISQSSLDKLMYNLVNNKTFMSAIRKNNSNSENISINTPNSHIIFNKQVLLEDLLPFFTEATWSSVNRPSINSFNYKEDMENEFGLTGRELFIEYVNSEVKYFEDLNKSEQEETRNYFYAYKQLNHMEKLSESYVPYRLVSYASDRNFDDSDKLKTLVNTPKDQFNLDDWDNIKSYYPTDTHEFLMELKNACKFSNETYEKNLELIKFETFLGEISSSKIDKLAEIVFTVKKYYEKHCDTFPSNNYPKFPLYVSYINLLNTNLINLEVSEVKEICIEFNKGHKDITNIKGAAWKNLRNTDDIKAMEDWFKILKVK